MRFEKKDRIALFIGIFAVALILWYVFFYLPKTKEIKTIKEQVKFYQSQNEVFSKMIYSLIQAKKEGEKVAIRYNELITQLPSKVSISNAMDQIKEVAKNSHIEMQILSIQLIDPGPFENGKNNNELHLTDVPVKIVLYGDFFGMVECLSYLIQRPFFNGYSEVSMEKTEGMRSQMKVQISCKFLVLNENSKLMKIRDGAA